MRLPHVRLQPLRLEGVADLRVPLEQDLRVVHVDLGVVHVPDLADDAVLLPAGHQDALFPVLLQHLVIGELLDQSAWGR